MLKLPLPGSEDLRKQVIEQLGPHRRPLLIAIDGPDGVGKSSLASWLAWQLGMPTVHLDLYLIRNSKPLQWRIDEVARIIDCRIGRDRPVIVEGILVLDVLDQINRRPDFLAYVRGEGGYVLSSSLNEYFARQEPERRAQITLQGFDE
jgi:hypothetical protein